MRDQNDGNNVEEGKKNRISTREKTMSAEQTSGMKVTKEGNIMNKERI